MISDTFQEEQWKPVEGFGFSDITYHRAKNSGTVRIAFHRPDCLNAFRPQTVDELYTALNHARQWSDVGCVLLTGNGPSKKHGKRSRAPATCTKSQQYEGHDPLAGAGSANKKQGDVQ